MVNFILCEFTLVKQNSDLVRRDFIRIMARWKRAQAEDGPKFQIQGSVGNNST